MVDKRAQGSTPHRPQRQCPSLPPSSRRTDVDGLGRGGNFSELGSQRPKKQQCPGRGAIPLLSGTTRVKPWAFQVVVR